MATVLRTHPAAELFPLLDGPELADLAEDIRANGLHEPVWLWRDPDHGMVLLDGRNRARACEIAGVPLMTRQYVGSDPIGFSISANVRRRHLTSGQLGFLALDVKALYEDEAKKAQVHGRTAPGDRERAGQKPTLPLSRGEANRHERESAARAAKAVGTSRATVNRAERAAKAAPDLAAKVKDGTLAAARADRIIRDREAEERRVAQAKQDAARLPERPRVDIRHGDFRTVLADLTGVDAVITDPPYPAGYLPLLADLAAWADKVLTPEGVLAVLIGQTHLPEVYRLLDGHRPYRWTMAYLTPGPGYASHAARVQSNWKPVILYGGGPRVADVLQSTGNDAAAKDRHRWGQDYGAFHTLIERLTRPGETVADPFAGSGTTLLAAYALGRHVVGADLDLAAVATARERVA